MPSSPSLVFGRGDRPIIDRDYELIKELGSGGFGQVWKASGEGGGDVALKIVNLAGLKEAKRELWALERINKVRHANLVTVSAAYVIDRTRTRLKSKDWDTERAVALLLVMTLCEKSLDKLLQEHRAAGQPGIPRDELLHYMEGAARGLDYLHKPNPAQGRDQAIVHCDIKPLNILIAGGEPLICDFGLARVFDTGDTKYTTQLGSIAYMPPEVLLEGKAATPPSDQYSLAISYIELRTGLLPFGSGEQVTLGDVNRALINDSHNLTRLEDGERGIIERAIAREPRNRYPTCLAMVEALRAATTEQPKQKSRGLIGKLFGGSDETASSRSSDSRTPTSSPTPSSQRQRKPKQVETMLAPPSPSPSPEEDPSTPVAARDDSARQSTAPPELGSLDTARVAPDVDHDSWTDELPASESEAESVTVGEWGTPGPARSREKSRRRMPVFTIGVGLFFLVAALVGFGIVPGKEQAVSLVKPLLDKIWKPSQGEEPPVEPPVEQPVKPFLAEMDALLEAKDFVSFIAKLNPPPNDVTFGDVDSLKKRAGMTWRDVLQRCLDDGELDEAAELLDPKLAEIADLAKARDMWIVELQQRFNDGDFDEAGQLLGTELSEIADLDKARDMWGTELERRLQEKKFAEAAQLLDPGFVDRVEDREGMREKVRAAWCVELRQCFDNGRIDEAAQLLDAELSEIADLDKARDMWGTELERRLQEKKFAEAAQLLDPGFVDRVEDSEGMREKVRAAWSLELRQRFADGEFAEAAELLDAKLSEIADLDAARGMWIVELEKHLQEKNFAEAAELLAPAFVDRVEDSEAMREKASATWCAELQQRFDDGEFADAAKLLGAELSAIIDREAGGNAWESTFGELLNKPDREEVDLKNAERLIAECDPGLVALSRADYEKKIAAAKGEGMSILLAWQEEMRSWLEAKKFNSVVDGFNNRPKEAQETDVEEIRKEAIKAWSAELKRCFAVGEFVEAAKLLDKNLSAISDLDAARDTWATELGKRFQERKFTEAAELLDDGFSTIRNPDKGQAAYKRTFDELLREGAWDEARRLISECQPELVKESRQILLAKIDTTKNNEDGMIRLAGVAAIQETWSLKSESPDTDAVLKKCETLLADLPDCAEARLIKTRALMEDQTATQDDYEKFQEIDASVLSADLKHLQKLLATFVLGESSDPDWEKICESLNDLDANPPAGAGTNFLQLTKTENHRFDALRERTVKFLLARIENRVDSAEFATAREDLQAAEGLARDEDQRSDLEYLLAIVNLRDPDSSRKQLADAVTSAGQFMSSGRAKVQKAEEIAEVMVALGKTSSPHVDLALLDDAMGLLRAACDRFKYGDELPQRFGELLVHATKLRIAQPAAPKEEELTQLQIDWRRTDDAGVEDALVEAWMTECLVRTGKDLEDADGLLARILDQIPEDDPYAAYGAYVRALVSNAPDRPRSDDVLEALDQAFGSPEAKQGILDKQDRLATAARMILGTTARQQARAGKRATDVYLLNNPFSSAAEAERYFRLLRKVEAIVDAEIDVTEADKPQAVQQRTLEVGLMLSALYRSEPELELAWSHASRLAQLSDAELATSALPVLASCVRTHLLMDQGSVTPDDHKIAIGACTRIARLLGDDEVTPDDASAAKAYDPILAPIESIVDSYAEGMSEATEYAIDPVVLEDFYAALGRLIWARQSARWPFAGTSEDVAEKTAGLFDWAIYLNGLRPGVNEAEKVAEYHLTCGHAKLALLDGDLASAKAHADKVLELTPNYYGAHGLQSNIFLLQSREQLTRADRLEDLNTAIERGERAIEDSPPDEPLLVTWLLHLGMAHVERANFTRDLSFETQKADLNRAIDYATRATKLENTYPDYPYLILGNAYEDLAWLVRDDAEANYQEAIKNFWTAADRQTYRRAQALYSLGRCYYKIVADSHLDPGAWKLQHLDRPSAEEMLDKAAVHLENATMEDPDLASGFFYLGLVRNQQANSTEADKNFQIAKDIALQKGFPAAGVYAQQWAAMGGASADTPETALELVQQRAQSLESESGPLEDVLRARARLVRVQSLVQHKKYDEALSLIEEALPEDLSGMDSEDVPLIMDRVECQIELLASDWNWEKAQRALSDAERAVELAYTRGFLSRSLFLRASIRFPIGSRVFNSSAEAENGPPPEWRGTEISQFNQGIDDMREAIRLVPDLEALPAADLRFVGVLLVFQKIKLIEARSPDLTPEETERYLGELRDGIQWADEYPQIPSTSTLAENRSVCAALKAAIAIELTNRSQPAKPAAESE